MGIVAGISSRPGLAIQTEHLRKYYDFVLGTGILFFLSGLVVLMVKLYQVQVVHSKEILVKAARVINRNGLPIYSYNPRIDKLTRVLAAGSIYDRNGLAIATSEPGAIRKNMDDYLAAGIDTLQLQRLRTKKRVVRFYPFEEDLFFGRVIIIPACSGDRAMVILPKRGTLPHYAVMQPVRKNGIM